MDIAVIGGHGKIARLLHPLLVEDGHRPVAVVRNEDYRADLEALGAEVRILDIENSDAADFAAAIKGCGAVVFAAGGGPDGNIERKRTVDLVGSLKSIKAAEDLGIRRFVQISAIGVDNPLPEDTDEVWQVYVRAKRDADVALRNSSLDWTIVRPGALTDEPATGAVALGPDVERGEVSRSDVAAVVAAALADDRTIDHQWNLVGGDTLLAEAIDAAVAGTDAEPDA